jgi:hypothetical protein
MKNNYLKLFTILSIGIILAILFFKMPPPYERILNIQNYLITLGGIFSGIVIAYLSGKIFQIKSERESRQIEIDKLSNKLTAFRKMIGLVKKSRNFWKNYEDINRFTKKYPKYDYYDYYNKCIQIDPALKVDESTILLYLAMNRIYDVKDVRIIPLEYKKHDETIRYDIEQLQEYYYPCNTIWYFLEGRYEKFGKDSFVDIGLNYNDDIIFKELIAIIDKTQKNKDFHREVIAKLGSDFAEEMIPKMIELISLNTKVPNSLKMSFFSLVYIVTFAVLLPIILQSINVCNNIEVILTLIFVLLTTLFIINFLFNFYTLIREEVETNVNKK